MKTIETKKIRKKIDKKGKIYKKQKNVKKS